MAWTVTGRPQAERAAHWTAVRGLTPGLGNRNEWASLTPFQKPDCPHSPLDPDGICTTISDGRSCKHIAQLQRARTGFLKASLKNTHTRTTSCTVTTCADSLLLLCQGPALIRGVFADSDGDIWPAGDRKVLSDWGHGTWRPRVSPGVSNQSSSWILKHPCFHILMSLRQRCCLRSTIHGGSQLDSAVFRSGPQRCVLKLTAP